MKRRASSRERHSSTAITAMGQTVVVMAVSWLVGAMNASAASGVISYQANQNPTNQDAYATQAGNQFWNRSDSGNPVGTGIVDGGTPAWSVARASVGAGEEFWTQTPLAADIATGNVEGWKLSARLRLPSTGLAPGFGSMIDYADGSKDWAMQFGTAANGDPIVRLFDNSSNPSFTLTGAGNTAYHDYRLAYRPGLGTSDLYVDDVLRISGFGGQAVGFTRILWGDAALSTTDQDVNYNNLLWVAPEPTTVTLVVAGAAALLFTRRRTRA